MSRTYRDLEIELDRCCHGEPEIRVLRSLFDRPRARFDLSEDERAAIEKKVARFDKLLLKKGTESERRSLAEEIGVELFEMLLPDEIGRTCERSLDTLRGNEGLRLRLSFGRQYDHALGGLPWELICRPDTRQFIANDPSTPIARYLDLARRIRPLEVEPPLKILVVIAGPEPEASARSYAAIDKEHHRARLQKKIGQTKHLQPRFLHELSESGRSTLADMREVLQKAENDGSPYHALHLLCHGGFDSDGEGALLFERENDAEHVVTARELARQLTQSVRLVVLTSCSTGKIPVPRRGGNHPFNGVASALVAEGLSAVVAMQFTVSEDATLAFSEGFYRSIDQDRPIDDAVAEGRLAIESRGDEGDLEWATPVLFLRAFDGRILDLRTDKIPSKTLSIFNVLHHGQEAMQRTDFQVDLRDLFEGRYIRRTEDWNGAVMDRLRHGLLKQFPAEVPCHLELAAPLSVAFAAGFLQPVKSRQTFTLGQRDETWNFRGEPSRAARPWLDAEKAQAEMPEDFPLDDDSADLAVIVEIARPALQHVTDYLGRKDLDPPKVRDVVVARPETFGQFAIEDGAHARWLAETLLPRIDAIARQGQGTVHLFLGAGPNGLAFVLGQHSQLLPRIQLYEFDFEGKRHGSYEPSILLESSMTDA